MEQETLKVFLQGLELLNVKLSQKQIEQFSIYLDELKNWNSKINLIGPATDKEIITNHFLDSLSIISVLPSTFSPQANLLGYLLPSTVLDIGTGAGFPGIPIKIAIPEISLTLLDSSKKKTEFLRHVCKKLDIKTEIISARAEDISKKPEYRGKYNIVSARAVAKAPIIKKICSPFLSKNGTIILQVSEKTDININGEEIMERYKLPSEILPGRTILSIKKKPGGFTLIELMVVVAIIGILASIAIPKFAEMMRRSKQGRTKGELGALRSALTLYYSDMEGMQYPLDSASVSNVTGPFRTKYLDNMPTVKLGVTSHDDTTDIDDFNDGDPSADLGNWGYIASQGKVFVNCSHTDTKGDPISSW